MNPDNEMQELLQWLKENISTIPADDQQLAQDILARYKAEA